MSEKTEVQQVQEILQGLDIYLRKLEWFPGNAALKWLADSASRTYEIASDKKQALKNINEMIDYIEELPWAEGNAAMGHAKNELKKCLKIHGIRKEEPKLGYDDPNPQSDKKSEATE